jgi:tRNA A37 threonylcarbamoyladenosine modification protein TsaB
MPFTILAVDRSSKSWNVKILKADGKITEYHEKIIRESSQVLNAAG